MLISSIDSEQDNIGVYRRSHVTLFWCCNSGLWFHGSGKLGLAMAMRGSQGSCLSIICRKPNLSHFVLGGWSSYASTLQVPVSPGKLQNWLVFGFRLQCRTEGNHANTVNHGYTCGKCICFLFTSVRNRTIFSLLVELASISLNISYPSMIDFLH